jgi:HNH endonuclease
VAKNNKKIKNELINKYGCKCQICNKYFEKDDLCIEHIKAKSVGGTNKKENLSLVCRSCNSKKYNYNTGNFPIESFFNRPDFFLKLYEYEKKNGVSNKKLTLENIEKMENQLEEKLELLRAVKNKIKGM